MANTYIDGSLLITPELCARTPKACSEEVEWVKRFHPNGFTVRQVANKEVRHIPIEFVCWGYHYLPFTEQDKNDWKEYAKVKECEGFFLSHHIENCKFISDSDNCENSSYVENSSDVMVSNHVYHSMDIQQSEYIHSSETIYESNYCNHAQKVQCSSYIFKSSDIFNSYAIEKCKDVKSSAYLRNCDNVRSAILSIDLNNVNRRILCDSECSNDLPCAILNKEVSEAVFVRVFRQLDELLRGIPYLYSGTNEKQDIGHSVPAMSAWIATLDQYWVEIQDILPPLSKNEKELAYGITLLPSVLKEI